MHFCCRMSPSTVLPPFLFFPLGGKGEGAISGTCEPPMFFPECVEVYLQNLKPIATVVLEPLRLLHIHIQTFSFIYIDIDFLPHSMNSVCFLLMVSDSVVAV